MNQLVKNLFRVQRAVRGKDIFFDMSKKQKKTVGNKGAEWTFDPANLCDAPIIYSFGIGTDISFDISLIEKYNAEIYGFDPTPKSIEWLEQHKLPKNFHFYNYGVGEINGMMDFYVPTEKNMVSGSISPNNNHQKIEVEIKKFSTIVKSLNHNYIDIVKMDIEGAEYRIIDDILNPDITINQILIEFHHRMPNFSLTDTKDAIRKILKAGYRIINISYLGEEYSFSKI